MSITSIPSPPSPLSRAGVAILRGGRPMRFLRSVLGVLTITLLLTAADRAPRFNQDNELVRPVGYREWIFIGASLGMSYDENAEKKRDPKFHNLYINPAAYREYKETGRFPEKTILVMEVLSAGSHSSINRQGHFEDRFQGIEAAVKDSSRFAESWAYFNFIREDGTAADTAKAFPKERCWSCHSEHAATDNVFTQFYPVLRP